jgi:hypothetical protein
MNAGKVPPAFAAPIRKPANFGSRCRLAAPLRRAMRGKGDSSAGSICNFLANTRAATVSSSAHCGEHWPSSDMLVLVGEQGSLSNEVSRRECRLAGRFRLMLAVGRLDRAA